MQKSLNPIRSHRCPQTQDGSTELAGWPAIHRSDLYPLNTGCDSSTDQCVLGARSMLNWNSIAKNQDQAMLQLTSGTAEACSRVDKKQQTGRLVAIF